MLRFVSRAVATLALVAATGTFADSQYPTKPVTIIVPFAAGGPTDTVARTIAAAMQKSFGQTLIIENVGGAGGTLGADKVAKASNDGYTLLLHHIGMSTAPALYRNLRFKPTEDFEPIGEVADVPMVFIGRADLQPNNFKELLAYIKKNGDKVNYGNAGIGSASHLCGLLFMSTIQVEMTTVPYKGTAPAMNDMLGGTLDVMCDQTTNTTSQIKAGKVKAYGATTPKRIASLPNIPTLDEEGIKGFEVSVWHAIYAPKGTPKPVIDKLVASLQEGLKDPTVKARFAELGTEPVAQGRATPESLKKHLKSEIDRWTPIIQKAGQYAD
jgi:tripartite-type tricarboxylate transporter receptor subunit TctC